MAVDLIASVVRVLKPDGSTAGTGFVVSREGLIATCAHVVQNAEAGPGSRARVVFRATGEEREVEVKPDCWRDPESGDVAVLFLENLPPAVPPLLLGPAGGSADHRFKTFGFPRARPAEGMFDRGEIVDLIPSEHARLQLHGATATTLGFSGAPVLDTETGCVVGMIATFTSPDKFVRQTETVFAIPAETLCSVAGDGIRLECRPARRDDFFLVLFEHNRHFVGRGDDLVQIHEKLRQRIPVGLVGMGGIGKTQLAAEYSHAYAAAYPGGVFWVNAAEGLRSEFARLGREIEPGTADAPPEVQIGAAARYLRTRSEALLVVDGLDDPAELNQAVGDDLVPADLLCRLLFTARERAGTAFAALDVAILPEKPSVRLLLSRLPAPPDEHHPDWNLARQVCVTLGWLPLALELAAAYLGEYAREVTLAGYLAQLEKEILLPPDEGANLAAEGAAFRHQAAIQATLRLHWHRLADRNARLLFQVAGQLREGSSIPLEHLALLSGLNVRGRRDASPLGRAASKLAALSLAREGTGDRLQLHPVIHQFAARLTAPDEQAAFRSRLEDNAVAALQDPLQRRQQAPVAGECLLSLQETPGWSPLPMRRATLEALRELMSAADAPPEDRRTAALLLTRLHWLDDAEDVRSEELSACLELAGRYLDAPGDREYLVGKIAAVLTSRPETASPRQQAGMLVYRAINLGYLHRLEEAARDYAQAESLAQAFAAASAVEPGDHRLWARIHLGMAHVAMESAEGLAEPGEEDRQREMQAQARNRYLAAAESARLYGQDPALEVTIQIELSAACASLGAWPQSEAAIRRAFEILDRVPDPSTQLQYRALILETAAYVRWQKGQALLDEDRPDDALLEYEAAYELSQEEIARLESSSESKTLALAHFNAGDYLLEMSGLPNSRVPEPVATACDHWRQALDVARRLGLPDVEELASERLGERCQAQQEA